MAGKPTNRAQAQGEALAVLAVAAMVLLAAPGASAGLYPVGLRSIAANLLLAPTTYSTGGANPQSIATADLNGDGRVDLVVGNQCTGPDFCGSPGSVAVLLNYGNGAFQAPVNYASGGSVLNAVAIADVNGDGKPDLITANECDVLGNCEQGMIGVLLGNGDGTFQPAATFGSGGYRTQAVKVADVNGDGILDIVVANLCSAVCNNVSPPQGSISVFLGVGNGTFGAPTSFASGGYSPLSLAAGDFNGDGKVDLVVPNTCGVNVDVLNCSTPGVAAVLLGNGDGTFETPVLYATGGLQASAVVLMDANEDNVLDLVVANCGGGGCQPGGGAPGNVAVLLGNGDGTFRTAAAYGAGGYYALFPADVNVDGHLDIVAASWACPKTGTGCVSYLRGNGDGSFQYVNGFDSGSRANAVAVADVNADSEPDLIVTHGYGNGVGLPAGTVDVLLAPSPILFETTTTTLTGSTNTGRTGTYVAVVSSPSGRLLEGYVTFFPGGPKTIFNNHAVVQIQWPVNTCGVTVSVTATYSGDSHDGGSSSNTVYRYIAKCPSRLFLTSSGSPSLVGQSVTFTARVRGEDGSLITFYDGKVLLGAVPLQFGQASFTTSSLSAGTHDIKATFPGDDHVFASYRVIHQIVNKYATTTTLTSAPNPASRKQPIVFTATLASAGPIPPTGAVQFFDAGLWIGAAKSSGGVATLTRPLPLGTHAITAKYLGDANSLGSTAAPINQVVE